MKRQLCAAVSLLLCGVLFAGCGKGSDSPSEKASTEAVTTQEQSEAAAPDQTEAVSAQGETEAGSEAEIKGTQGAEASLPLPEASPIETAVTVMVDGAATAEGGYDYEAIMGDAGEMKLGDAIFYGVPLAQLTGGDLSDASGAFVEATDGYVMYFPDAKDLALAVYQANEETYEVVTQDGAAAYAVVSADGASSVAGAENIYFVTAPCEFEVDIQVNGESVGKLTRADFMKKTHTGGDERIPTSMYDGSFKYNQGSSTYTGRFLGIDYETMLTKLQGIEGISFDAEAIKEVEYYGTPGLGEVGKNGEYTLYPDEDTYYANAKFFCMYDGMTYNPDLKDVPVGLTAFIDGTGMRWVTFNLTAINIVTE